MRALCRPAPGARPGPDLGVVMWRALSSTARWTLLGWGFTEATLTLGAYASVRGIP